MAKKQPDFVVGLGASAGGLEALERFFDQAPKDSGGAFIVVMHLSRDFKSMLDELLARHTDMPVRAAIDGDEIHANEVYVIQPGTTLELKGRAFKVAARPTVDNLGPATSIDTLFQSLANEWGERAGAVVLSGSGSDGSKGVVSINEAGGFACAQSPETAKFDSMLLSAISTQVIRAVEAPEQLAATVIDGILLPRLVPTPHVETDHENALARILNAVVGVTTLDASRYKHSTFERRVRRRMMDLQLNSISAYAKLVASDPVEAQILSDTLLIGVTEFFRDPDAFKVIGQQIVPELIRRAQTDRRPVRIWTPGCATGEEAYTLALLFANAIEDNPQKTEIQIFATDVKREYLNQAGRGEFDSHKLERVPTDIRNKYFAPVNGSGRLAIDPDVRKMIVFAPHDVLSDPPFTRLDMISCRNLLIYFSVETQQEVMRAFAFGLMERGFLFLGSSETVGGYRQAFEFIDARNRIFRRTSVKPQRPTFASPLERARQEFPAAPAAPRRTLKIRETALQPAYASLLKDYAPASLLVSGDRELLHSFGDARKFLRPPEGIAHLDAAEMVDPAIKTPMITGIERVLRDKKAITFSKIKLKTFPSAGLVVDMTLKPLMIERLDEPHHVLVIIDELETDAPLSSIDTKDVISADALVSERIEELELELERTREALQSTIEEIETTNEELQASNEELMSSNEELQSTNEELSSVNEELYSVNAEYHRQNDELMRLNNNFDLLLQSTEIGVIFLDTDLNITRYTSLAGALFNLTDADIGRPLSNFRSPFVDIVPDDFVSGLIDGDQPDVLEAETLDADEHAWLLRASVGNIQKGIVLTMISIDRLRTAEADARRVGTMLGAIQAMTGAFFLEIQPDLKTVSMELGHTEFVGDSTRKGGFALDFSHNHEDDRAIIEEALARATVDEEAEVIARLWHDESQTYRYVRYAAVKYPDDTWHITGIDIDQVVRAREAATEREAILNAILRASPSLISFVDTDEKYRYVNAAYERQWNVKQKDIVGRTVKDFLPESLYEGAKPNIDAALRGERREFMLENELEDGRQQTLSVVYEPVRDEESGEVYGFAVDTLDVTRFYKQSEALENHDRLMASAVRSASYPMLLVDTETARVEFLNKAASDRLGMNGQTAIDGKIMASRLTPDWSDRRWVQWLSGLTVGEDSIKEDVTVFDKMGQTGSADIYAIILDDAGQKKALVRTFDNSERNLILHDLQARSRELAMSNRDLEQFASIIAHDLRAPLRHITQFGAVLSDIIESGTTDGAKDYLDIINESVESMSGMVEGLMDYARTGRAIKAFKPTDLGKAVKKAREFLTDDIRASKATLTVGKLPTIDGDLDLLTTLFQNLISNSIKYANDDTPPEIEIKSRKYKGNYEVRVSDNGIGISKEYEEKIFQLFQRLHNDDKYTGLGVGLASCRRIAELHSGSLKLNTRYKNGSEFVLYFPIED